MNESFWSGRGLVASLLLAICAAGVSGRQPARMLDGEHRRADLLWVQFAEGTGARLRGGMPSSVRGAALDGIRPMLNDLAARGFEWSRGLPSLTEEEIDGLRRDAARRAGKPVPDQNLLFLVRIPAGEDGGAWIERLSQRPEIEWASGVELPVRAPGAPDFTGSQGYAQSAPAGTGAWLVSAFPGGTGAGVNLVDVEYSWNLSHLDLPAGIQLIGAAPVDPFNDQQHGTAVLGEVVSLDNGMGTRGLAPGVSAAVVAANTASGYNVANAINLAALTLGPGDVILIEQQTAGPRYTGASQLGLLPVEWNRPTYNAIVTAVQNGIVVIEAAGNGSQDLDDPIYQSGNGGHWPFLPANDSGAIIVGAGRAAGGTARSRLGFSNFGQTVDVQGWGESVTTTGYGNAYSAEGPNLYFTFGFSGTSSASPIVASAACLLQSTAIAQFGSPLTPAQVRQFLIDTGTPQTGNTAEHIGPLVDAFGAVVAALNAEIDPPAAFSLTTPADGSTGVARPVLLGWEEAAGAASYRLRVDDHADFSSPIVDADGLVGTSYVVPNNIILPETVYYWTVEARNIGGVTSGTPTGASFETTGSPPGSFAITSPADGANVTTLTPSLLWQASAGADRYEVTVSTLANLTNPLLLSINITATSIQVPAGLLLNGVRYYWGVRAANAFGQTVAMPGVASFGVLIPFCLGDANSDGTVNFADINAVLANWGTIGPTGDANGDDVVNFPDITTVLAEWLNACF